MGAVRLFVLGCVASACSLASIPDLSSGLDASVPVVLLDDGFEAAAIDFTKWTDLYDGGMAALSVSTNAHRGMHGLSFDDANKPGLSGIVLRFALDGGADGGLDVHTRFWFRLRAREGNGYSVLAAITQRGPTPTSLGQTGTRLFEQVWFTDSGFNNVYVELAPLGTWQLVELSAKRTATASMNAVLRLDGKKVADQTLDRRGDVITGFEVGQQLSNDWAGGYDFDDVRVDTKPLASALWVSSENAAPGTCTPLIAELRDTDDQLTPAPYPLEVELDVNRLAPDGGIAGSARDTLFSDPGCSTLETRVSLPAGLSRARLWWKPGGAGTYEARASQLDFASVPAQLTAE